MAQARRKAEEATALDLAALGLDQTASAVYDQLLRAPDVDAVGVAQATHASRATVEAALSQLVRAGLARAADRPVGVEALRPESALAQQISLKQRDAADHVGRLSELREEIADLERLWRRNHRGDVETREFEIVRGVSAAIARLDALRESSSLVRSTDQHRTSETRATDEGLGTFERWLRDGGQARWIDELAYAQAPGWGDLMQRVAGLGVEARLVETINIQFRVFDDAVAVLPLQPSYTPAGVVICRSEGIVAALLDLFESLWQRAVDWTWIANEHDSPVAGVDSRLVHLLASTSCDDAIARTLGISSRTVRRQVAALMSFYGVQTRLQLGAALERTGALSRP